MRLEIKSTDDDLDDAAANFMSRITNGAWPNDEFNKTYLLARTAFLAYAIDWPEHRITEWKWPYDELSESKPFGKGDQPWTVLFARAIQTVKQEAKSHAG